MKIIISRGLNEEREGHSQLGLSSLLGHAMINSSPFEMSHSIEFLILFTSPNLCDSNACIFVANELELSQ